MQPLISLDIALSTLPLRSTDSAGLLEPPLAFIVFRLSDLARLGL